MEIRKASLADCEALTQVRLAMQKERKPEFDYSEEYIEATLNYIREGIAQDTFVSYIALDEGNIVACSGICFYQVPPTWDTINGKVAYIMNMYTAPSHRKQGLAAKLLDGVVGEARARGCTKVTLTASEMGESLYLKYGFKKVNNAMAYAIDAQ